MPDTPTYPKKPPPKGFDLLGVVECPWCEATGRNDQVMEQICYRCDGVGHVLSREAVLPQLDADLQWLYLASVPMDYHPLSQRNCIQAAWSVLFIQKTRNETKKVDEMVAMLQIIAEELRPVRDSRARHVVNTVDAFAEKLKKGAPGG